jgi:hypothetical protein
MVCNYWGNFMLQPYFNEQDLSTKPGISRSMTYELIYEIKIFGYL